MYSVRLLLQMKGNSKRHLLWSVYENEFVCYDLEEIKYGTVIYNGVKSPDFLGKGWQIITLERLFRNFFGESLQMRWIE